MTSRGAARGASAVWKTEKSWAGTGRRLDLGLADTTSQSIVFEFKS